MRFEVGLHFVLAHEGFVAAGLCALERTMACVLHQMALSIDKVHKGSVTAREGTRIRTDSCVDSLKIWTFH